MHLWRALEAKYLTSGSSSDDIADSAGSTEPSSVGGSRCGPVQCTRIQERGERGVRVQRKGRGRRGGERKTDAGEKRYTHTHTHTHTHTGMLDGLACIETAVRHRVLDPWHQRFDCPPCEDGGRERRGGDGNGCEEKVWGVRKREGLSVVIGHSCPQQASPCTSCLEKCFSLWSSRELDIGQQTIYLGLSRER